MSRVSLLLWSLPIIAFLLINAIWLLPSLRDITEANNRFRLEVVRRAADDIGLFVAEKAQALLYAAERIRFDQERQKEHLERILKEHREFNSVSILDAQGKELLKVSRFEVILPEDLRDFSDTLRFEIVSEAGVWYGQVKRTENLEPVMSVAVPLLFGQEEERGVLVGELNLKRLSSEIGRFRFGTTGKVYVVDEGGTLIIDPDISLVLQNPDFRDRSILQELQTKESVSEAYYRNERNSRAVASGVVMPSLRWRVIGEQSVGEVNASRNRIIALALLSGGLGLLLSLFLVVNNVRLARLTLQLLEQKEESDETAKILVRKDRELMLTNQKLIERTRDLEEAGKLLVRRDLELTQSNERLRELDEIKSQFVSVAAHQLRTPLAGIKWTLYSLLEERSGKLNTQQKKFAGDAYKATLRLIELINDLLDVARLEEGRFGFKMKKQDFLSVVERSYHRFEQIAKEKGITFSLHMPKEKIPELEFDEEKITIALENFLDNALKYTPPGGKVTVNVSKGESEISCAVADTGIGIPEEQLGKVFTKFFRAENAQLTQTSGTGVGLYVAKNIIEHHKGAVFFTTKENKGSTFIFTLPIPKAS